MKELGTESCIGNIAAYFVDRHVDTAREKPNDKTSIHPDDIGLPAYRFV